MRNSAVNKHIVNWLKNYLSNHELQGFVVGISGGIDSALTSALCAQTGYPLLCLDMPLHQDESQTNRAEEHIAWLQEKYPLVTSKKIELTQTFDTMVMAFSDIDKNSNQSLALANTRARLRMTTLYYFAGLKGFIVAGTGNKVEDFGIGFYTKYGDGGVDISPIADLYKSEVYELAAFLKIDESILQAQPTDGLYGNHRTDEEQIGATYPELEWAMEQAKIGKTENDFEGRKKEIFQIYQHRHKVNKHKWKPIPVCKIPDDLKK